MPWKRTTDIAREKGVTTETVRRWIASGRFERVEQIPTGHFRIWIDADLATVGYCRVSSSKQRSSLDTQAEIIGKRYPEAEIKNDVGSGFNFKRKAFAALLERALRGDPIKLVVATQDRVTRSGFPLVRRIFELSGASIQCLEESDSPDQFDIGTFVAFLTSFCNSQSGKRSHRRKKDQGLPKEPASG